MSDGPLKETQTGAAKIKRDEMGFVTSAQPHLSLPQIRFLLALSTHGHDLEAAQEAARVTDNEMAKWMGDEEFAEMLRGFISNKREGVKQVGGQLTPLMLLTLTEILENGDNKSKLTAIKLLAQLQGMLITQNTVADKGVLEAIREQIMAPRPIYKELPPNGRKT